jgi:hypothetical protein
MTRPTKIGYAPRNSRLYAGPGVEGGVGYDPDVETGEVTPPIDHADSAFWEIPFAIGGSPDYVQHKRGTLVGGLLTTTLDALPSPGNILVYCIPLRENIGVVPILSGTGWTLIRTEFTGAEDGNWPMHMYWRQVEGGDGAVWTADIAPVATGMMGYVIELSGVDGLDEDVGDGDDTGEGTISITPVTSDPIIIISAVSVRNDSTDIDFTPATGMTEIVDDMLTAGAVSPNVGINYRVIASPTGSYTVGSTLSTTVSQRAIIAASFVSTGEATWLNAPAVHDGSTTTFESVLEGWVTAADLAFLRGTLATDAILTAADLRLALEDAGSATVTVEGATDIDFTSPDELGSLTFTGTGSYTPQDITIPLSGDGYPFVRFLLDSTQGVRPYEVTLDGVPDASVAVDEHLADTTDAHDASAISIVDTGGYFTGTDVEAALQELGLTAGGTLRWEAVTDGEDVFVWESDDLVHEYKEYL